MECLPQLGKRIRTWLALTQSLSQWDYGQCTQAQKPEKKTIERRKIQVATLPDIFDFYRQRLQPKFFALKMVAQKQVVNVIKGSLERERLVKRLSTFVCLSALFVGSG